MSEHIVIEQERDGLRVYLEALALGEDYSVSITGGDRPHIGAAALGTPYAKPDGSWSACASVFALPTHKEDALAQMAAQALAKRLRRTVLVSCGIHVDDLAPAQIAAFVALAEKGIEALSDALARRQQEKEF